MMGFGRVPAAGPCCDPFLQGYLWEGTGKQEVLPFHGKDYADHTVSVIHGNPMLGEARSFGWFQTMRHLAQHTPPPE